MSNQLKWILGALLISLGGLIGCDGGGSGTTAASTGGSGGSPGTGGMTSAGGMTSTGGMTSAGGNGRMDPERDPGPNLPDGLSQVFVFDVTQPDQKNLNPDIIDQKNTEFWEKPQTSPARGLFVDQKDGGVVYARWAWAEGDKTRAAGSEIKLSHQYTEWYIRTTWRANPNWQFSGGTVKQLFLQKTPWVQGESQNWAPGVQKNGRIASINTGPELQGPTPADMGEWIDDEWYIRPLPGPATVTAWRNGVEEFHGTGLSMGNVAANLLSLGPYHGGSGIKSQDDWWEIRRLVIWAR